MKFLVAVPDHPYYLWQVLVQINNFKKMGIESDTIYVFGIFNKRPSPRLMRMVNSPQINAKFYFINDTRRIKAYSSSLRPHIISKFYSVYDFSEPTVFYLDPDVLFTKKMDFSVYEKDNLWYVSDTRSYVSAQYIKSKSPELFTRMCNIVGISPELVEKNDQDAGGAQYIMKGVTAQYWEKVYTDSEALYNLMIATASQYNPSHPIQAWTADMWAVLWNGWLAENEIKIDKSLEFSWASDPIARWDSTNIFHNAGVVKNDGKHFSKNHYQISPFNKQTLGEPESASWNYILEIKDTEKNFPELLF